MARRPVRDNIEERFDRLPSGPFGKVGRGNVAGAAGYATIEAVKAGVDLVPGVREPGWNITAHTTKRREDFTDHILVVDAVSGTVARFAAKYQAPPSNIDYLTSEVEILDVEVLEERSTYNTYRITVRVDERGRIE